VKQLEKHPQHVASGPIDIMWHPESRLAVVRYAPDTNLVGEDGRVLVDALAGWIGTEHKRFGVLADAKGVCGTDAEYRSKMGAFFKLNRKTAFVALTNMGAVIRIITEMLRIGTGMQLKAFADDSAARAWLRGKGIAT
jgi:hypothetical protein